jgi:uncharacterized phage protein (TIGR02218 family)
MRAASAELIAFLASRQPFWSADLYTISLRSGSTLRLTGADRSVSFGLTTWLAASETNFALTRKSWQIQNTMDVPQLTIDLISSGTDFSGGSNVKLAIHNGLFDGAWCQMDRAFMPIVGGQFGDTALGTVPIFAGPVGETKITGLGATVTVRGANIRHQQYMPRNRFLAACIHALYDAGCGVSRSAHTFSGVVSGASSIAIGWASDPTSGHWADLPGGIMTVTSGVGVGQTRSVQFSSSSGISFVYPFYEVPAPGDTFDVTYGCDKNKATCSGRFGNLQNYRGFPYVPPAEMAVTV